MLPSVCYFSVSLVINMDMDMYMYTKFHIMIFNFTAIVRKVGEKSRSYYEAVHASPSHLDFNFFVCIN